MKFIIDLPEIAASLKKEDKKLFDRFFRISITKCSITLTEEMKPWADATFGDHHILSEQKIIKIMNLVSGEQAIFNEVRAKRPMEMKPSEEALKEIGTTCEQFCHPEQFTPTDPVGRIKGKYCITGANLTNFETHHGLIIFNKHNPLDCKMEEIQDYLETGARWMEKCNSKFKDAIYPFLMWNCLWRSGATINHGHMQVLLGEGFHHAEAELCRRMMADYRRKHKADYFSDLFRVHKAIGLALKHGKTSIITSITPKKDKEVLIISKKFDQEYMKVLAKTAVCLINDMGVESFNMGVIFPPLTRDSSWKGFPVITRFVDRGKLGRKGSEIAGQEYISKRPVVEVDPYKVFEKLELIFA